MVPEVMAPAGDIEALKAAVQNGADAVYLAGQRFGARAHAENFSEQELIEVFKYCHLYGVNIYVTVNTLMDNAEFTDLYRYIRFLYEQGVDGLIVQDLGAAKMIREVFPGIPLHASTQMTVHNASGIRFLEEFGFSRVVLARETTLTDLCLIRGKTGLALEVFVHGALCICYSGQCLLGSLVGGRSGNRGRCAQPCRLAYTLINEKGQEITDDLITGAHLLSTRDLSLLTRLPDLFQVGVKAWKIEGRMKSPEYVATVVKVYRQAVQRLMADPENYCPTVREMEELAQVFNRGFTAGHFAGQHGLELMNYKRPNHRGLSLGRVEKVKDGQVSLKLAGSLKLQDVLEFWVTRGGRCRQEVKEMRIGDSLVKRAEPGQVVNLSVEGPVQKGDRVFKIYDHELMERARRSYQKPYAYRKIPLDFRVKVQTGQVVSVTVSDDAGNRVETTGAVPAERAKKHPLTVETLKKKLGRLGDTPYALSCLEALIEGDLMVPLSDLNEVRRRLVSLLTETRLKKTRPVFDRGKLDSRAKEFFKKMPGPFLKVDKPLLSVFVGDLAGVEAAVRAGADRVYFGGEGIAGTASMSEEEIYRAVDCCRQTGTESVVVLPRWWHEEEEEEISSYIAKIINRSDAVLIGSLGLVNRPVRIYTDFAIPVYNDWAAYMLKEKGVNQVTLSPELNFEQIEQLACRRFMPVECLVHGAVKVMVSEYRLLQSLIKGERRAGRYFLRDRKNAVFPVETGRGGLTHVYNSKELCMFNHLHRFLELGIFSLRIEAERENAGYVTEVVTAYRQELDRLRLSGGEPGMGPRTGLFTGDFTTGHYFRGVL